MISIDAAVLTQGRRQGLGTKARSPGIQAHLGVRQGEVHSGEKRHRCREDELRGSRGRLMGAYGALFP